LRVEGEILPGLPLCHAVDLPGFPDLITKSGGFGPPDTLLRLWQAARNPEGCP
jgi:D-threonate/D-erythronate kinase